MIKLFILMLSISQTLNERIAIVGAGIGGSSAAHYLLKTNNITVDIYERTDTVGGRVQSQEIKGHMINIGASFFIKTNRLIYDLTKELNVDINPTSSDDQKVSIVNGHNILIDISDNYVINIVKFLWRYGLAPLYAKNLISDRVAEFIKIYDHLDNKNTFENLESLLKTINLGDLTSYTIEEYLLKNDISQKYIDEVVSGLAAGIYSQDKTINAFAGFIALAGSNEDTYEITKGNNYLIQALIDYLKLNPNFGLYLNQTVNTITKYNDKYYIGGNEYDRVIIACPLEKTGITFENITINNTLPHYFKEVHVTVIEGEVSPTYFYDRDDVPNTFVSTQKNLTENVSDLLLRDDYITTISSDDVIADEGFPILSEGYRVLFRKHWDFAYPQFVKVQPENLPLFVLDKGLYYINAIETAGSCQELSMISARNIVNIIEKDLERKRKVINRKEEDI
jgi:prenylcysteine oxidase/farnesylcysteine lyase